MCHYLICLGFDDIFYFSSPSTDQIQLPLMGLFAFARMLLAGIVLLLWAGITSASDIDALLEFRSGIIDDPSGSIFDTWRRSNVVGSNACPINWYGIQCGESGISSIMLEDLGLVGKVSLSALTGIGSLRNLSISNNSLTGLLPVEMAGSLEFLDLSSNKFGGMLPGAFGKLGKLVHLDLRGNRFSGDLDGVLVQLQSAVYVDFSGNQFSGSLKSISDNASITSSLQYLNVSRNGLTGKLFVDDMVPLFDSLEVFDASFNQLSGDVPAFNFIVSLKILRLENNLFSGSLPELLLKDSSMVLSELDLSCNQLKGPVTTITSASLKNLNLSMNQLSGSLPLRVGSCAIVDLSNNKLSGNLSKIQSWGNFVEVVDLSSNLLTGTLPNETSQFLRLISFKASNNLLAGEVPLVIGTYPELNFVDLSLNKLNGSIPPSLFTSLRLAKLNLSGNSFTGSIPFPNSKKASTSSDASFTTQTSLVSLDLSNNSLSGTLPPDVITLSGLNLLDIGRNNISGSVPKEIGMLRGLLYLDLSDNHFEGNIPDNLPDSLQGLNVSYNNLSGVVPGSLMKFPDSSFHPGNSLLTFPRVPSNISSFSGRRKHNHHVKDVIRYALIAGVVASAVVILLSLLFYRRINGKIRRKNTNQRRSPIHNLFGNRKSADMPPASSFSQDQLLQWRSGSMPREHGDLSLPARKSEESEIQDASTTVDQSVHSETSSISAKNEGKSSMSHIISSPPLHNPHFAERPSIISVCSSDRLSGDLHLFDNSFVLTAEDLSRAPAEIIGRSCHGTSYQATIDSGHMLTVKWLREGIWKPKKEFVREAKKLGNIRHPNIVTLRGYYWGPKEHERLIISDYIDAASLTTRLCEFGPRNLQPLSLNQRLNIAVDISRGLNYLHNERSIPHGNLKSTNILIQNPNMNALLADYSLHRLMTPYGMAEQVLNAGALGYRPPEFASTSKPCPSLKGDVYAFGVILLELLTGKNAGEIVSGNRGVVDLTDWVRLLASENRANECFDRLIPEVDGLKDSPRAPKAILGVALRCIRSASERPEIGTIFDDLCSISS